MEILKTFEILKNPNKTCLRKTNKSLKPFSSSS